MGAIQIDLSMQPSLYAQFLKEVHGLDCLEYEWGYATYELGPDYVYIIDIFVKPELRSAHKGVQLMHEIESIAKQKGAIKMYGSVAITSKEAMKNYKMLQHLGFQDSHQNDENLYLVREISRE